MTQSRVALAAVTDMFFVAKMQAAAGRAGVNLVFVASVEELLDRARSGADLVILDLNDAKLDCLAAIQKLASEETANSIPTLGFLSHVDTELAARAAEAGCERVLPRSRFSSSLVELLRGSE